MLTSALISLASIEAPDWSRIRILTFLDEIQKMIFSQNATKAMRIYDSVTGLDPVLTTSGTSVEYNINTTNGFSHNAWRVYEVYTDDITDPEKDVLTFDATPLVPYARVVFPYTPSGNYYLRCYRSPTTLTSESVQLEIPAGYHLSHVFDGLMGFIEKFRSGKSERYDNFIQNIMPDLVKKMSDGKRGNSDVPYRPAG